MFLCLERLIAVKTVRSTGLQSHYCKPLPAQPEVTGCWAVQMSGEGAEAQRMAQQLGRQGLAGLEGRLDRLPARLRQLLTNGQYEVRGKK